MVTFGSTVRYQPLLNGQPSSGLWLVAANRDGSLIGSTVNTREFDRTDFS